MIVLCLPLAILGLGACAPPRLVTLDIDHLQMSAHTGDAKARLSIGELYEFGAGVPADPLIAAQWYQLSARQGDADAQYYLGVMYATGQGLKRNEPESVRWLFKAAEQGHEKSRILLAALYLKEKDLRQDFAKQVKAYRQRAEKGQADAQYALGWICMEGAGLPVNAREAIKWYQKAAALGHTGAQSALGGIYLSGKETPANPREALAWYQKSAENDIRARVKLCALYQRAGGLPENKAAVKECLEQATRSTPAAVRSYMETQHTLLNTEKEKHPALALRACQRIREFDPAAEKVTDVCNALQMQNSVKMKAGVSDALAALERKDFDRYRNLSEPLITPDFDDNHFRRLVAAAWRLTEEENRAFEKNAQEQLRALETLERTVSYRSGNVIQINKAIGAFRTTLAQALRDNPEDPALTGLLRKGNRVIALIRQKMKTPPPPEEKAGSESSEDQPEEADPGEEDYLKAQSLLNSGRFKDAEALFEKTTRTRGSKYVASAYIYLGISHLARINPANVQDARKRHLKGLASFQNALRFDGGITLPAGYDKYQPEFNKAREQLR